MKMAACQLGNVCPKCHSEDMEKDECASEEMLVCKSCGNILEAGSFDMRREFISGPAGHGNSQVGSSSSDQHMASLRYASFGGYYENMPSTRIEKKKRIITYLDRLADKMRLQNHEKKLCYEKVDEVVKLVSIWSFKPEEALAASIIFVCASATDQSSTSIIRRLVSHGSFKEKVLRKMIKLVKTLSSVEEEPNDKLSLTDTPSVFLNYLEMLGIDMNSIERKKCLDISGELFELFHETVIKDHYLRFKPVEICSLLLVALEHVRKKKDQDLEKRVADRLYSLHSSIAKGIGKVRSNLFKLSKQIPSLVDLIESGSLTVHCVVRYIPTILQNNHYITSVQKTLSKEEASHEKNSGMQHKRLHSSRSGEPCVPQEFHWPEDDSESLELLDVEQYLASDEEKEKEGAGQGERDIIKIAAKRRALEAETWGTS